MVSVPERDAPPRRGVLPYTLDSCTIWLVRVHLITAESPESRRLRRGRLIQFPQLTMPLLAALTPPEESSPECGLQARRALERGAVMGSRSVLAWRRVEVNLGLRPSRSGDHGA